MIINPLLLFQGMYHVAKTVRERQTPEMCLKCRHFIPGRDFCEESHYVQEKEDYCSDFEE